MQSSEAWNTLRHRLATCLVRHWWRYLYVQHAEESAVDAAFARTICDTHQQDAGFVRAAHALFFHNDAAAFDARLQERYDAVSVKRRGALTFSPGQGVVDVMLPQRLDDFDALEVLDAFWALWDPDNAPSLRGDLCFPLCGKDVDALLVHNPNTSLRRALYAHRLGQRTPRVAQPRADDDTLCFSFFLDLALRGEAAHFDRVVAPTRVMRLLESAHGVDGNTVVEELWCLWNGAPRVALRGAPTPALWKPPALRQERRVEFPHMLTDTVDGLRSVYPTGRLRNALRSFAHADLTWLLAKTEQQPHAVLLRDCVRECAARIDRQLDTEAVDKELFADVGESRTVEIEQLRTHPRARCSLRECVRALLCREYAYHVGGASAPVMFVCVAERRGGATHALLPLPYTWRCDLDASRRVYTTRPLLVHNLMEGRVHGDAGEAALGPHVSIAAGAAAAIFHFCAAALHSLSKVPAARRRLLHAAWTYEARRAHEELVVFLANSCALGRTPPADNSSERDAWFVHTLAVWKDAAPDVLPEVMYHASHQKTVESVHQFADSPEACGVLSQMAQHVLSQRIDFSAVGRMMTYPSRVALVERLLCTEGGEHYACALSNLSAADT